MPVRLADPCDRCGMLYLEGTETTCNRCLHRKVSKKPRWRIMQRQRLRCDCGKPASAVVLVRVGFQQDGLSEQRMPVCLHCLEIEKETQAKLDRLGYGSD